MNADVATNHRVLTDGTDLDYVLTYLAFIDPIDIESEDPTERDWETHATIRSIRDAVLQRKSATLGVDGVADCGTSRHAHHPGCGPELGLPTCTTHRTCQHCDKARDHTVWDCPANPHRTP